MATCVRLGLLLFFRLGCLGLVQQEIPLLGGRILRAQGLVVQAEPSDGGPEKNAFLYSSSQINRSPVISTHSNNYGFNNMNKNKLKSAGLSKSVSSTRLEL